MSSKFSTEELAKRKLEKQKKLVQNIKEKQRLRSEQYLYKLCNLDDEDGNDHEYVKKIRKSLSSENSIEALRYLKIEFEKAAKERCEGDQNPKDFLFPHSEEFETALNNPGFQMVLEFIEIEAPSKGNNWCIPKSFSPKDLEMKKDSLFNFITYDIELFKCKSCKYSFDRLPQHLRQSNCKEAYSSAELDELQGAKLLMRKRSMKSRYQENKEEIAQKYQEKKAEIAEKRITSKGQIAEKNASYYKKNKLEISLKGYKYYAKHKESILEKRAAHYKNKHT